MAEAKERSASDVKHVRSHVSSRPATRPAWDCRGSYWLDENRNDPSSDVLVKLVKNLKAFVEHLDVLNFSNLASGIGRRTIAADARKGIPFQLRMRAGIDGTPIMRCHKLL